MNPVLSILPHLSSEPGLPAWPNLLTLPVLPREVWFLLLAVAFAALATAAVVPATKTLLRRKARQREFQN